MRLQPVSDLQRAQRFDDYDLTANRNGVLSSRQRWTILGIRLLEHLIGVLVVVLAAALIINTFQMDVPIEWLGLTLGSLLLATLLLWGLRARAALISSVQSATGELSQRRPLLLGGAPFEEVAIGLVSFYVRPEVYDVLDEGAIYKVYYLERNPRLGGNVLLSAEVIRDAPSDDDYDEDDE